MSTDSIYLNYGATSPVSREVFEAMAPYLTDAFGNPSSVETASGRKAEEAVSAARSQVAHAINAEPVELVFTSGATESNNLAILGTAREVRRRNGRTRIAISTVEHKAVLAPASALEREGFEVVLLPVDSTGRVDLKAAERLIDTNTLLVSVQLANHELGTIQPIHAISSVAHSVGALCHSDGAQGLGKMPIDVLTLGVDLLSLSAHKAYGPKGVGALYLRNGPSAFPIQPLLHGGSQESGLRPGTLNVPAIVGFGRACRLVEERLPLDTLAMQQVRDRFEQELSTAWPSARFNGDSSARLPGNTSVTFPGIEAEALLALVPTLELSTSSACSSGAPEPSHVLQAIGLHRELAYSTLRVVFGRDATLFQADAAARQLARAASDLSSQL